MPLTAITDGEPVVSSLLDDQRWLELQAAVRAGTATLTLHCGRSGHLRTSHLGTRHFAHNPGEAGCGGHGRESAEHLAAKDTIVRAATAAGWHAEPEVPVGPRTADVLASRGAVRVAFEVQLSRQTGSDFLARQADYRAAGVRAAWFTKHEPDVGAPAADLPVFRLRVDDTPMSIVVGARSLSLDDAVRALLAGRVQFRDVFARENGTVLTVHLHTARCWKCSASNIVWNVVEASTTGGCEQKHAVHLEYEVFATARPEALPPVRAAVREWARAHRRTAAGLSERYTKTSGQKYLAYSCTSCNAVSGDIPLSQEYFHSGARPTAELTVTVDAGAPRPHWCLDVGDGHCRADVGTYSAMVTTDARAARAPHVHQGISIHEAIGRMFGGSY